MDRKMLALEATRDLTKVWAHVDMDAFYAAAEELANPSLVGTVISFLYAVLKSMTDKLLLLLTFSALASAAFLL